MSENIISLRGGQTPPEIPKTLWRAIYLWLLSKFHVHHWQDDPTCESGTLTNMNGGVTGYFRIQRCMNPACSERRMQRIQ